MISKYPDDKLYRFVWRDGSTTEGFGRDVVDAYKRLGLGSSVLASLSHYVPVERNRMVRA